MILSSGAAKNYVELRIIAGGVGEGMGGGDTKTQRMGWDMRFSVSFLRLLSIFNGTLERDF